MFRREFLSGGLAAAAAPEGRIRIAVLGATHPHAEAKIRLLRESALWDLAGVAEDAPSARALLADPSVRVVAVESGVARHAADARAALDAGKHVHLEKAPATTMREFRDIVAEARRRNLLLQMGYMWRYHPGFNAILEAARNGWLGEIYLVRGIINTLTPPQGRGAIGQFPGGQMFELGCHLIDPLVRMLGLPAKITPFLRSDGGFNDSFADNAAAVFEYPRAMGIISSSALQPKAFPHRAFEVYGSNGSAVLRPLEPGTLSIDLVKAAGPYRASAQQVNLPSFRRYEADFAELAAAVRLGKPLSIPPEEDLKVQEALLRASNMWS